MKISIVGCGKMGEAILKGLIKSGFKGEDIFITTKSKKHVEDLIEKYGVNGSNRNYEAVDFSDFLILSIKPKNLKDVSSEIKGRLKNKILISILAGVPIEKLKESFGMEKVVRCMPNLPARVGNGITIWKDHGLNEDERGKVKRILSSFGKEIYVEREEFIDIGTSISGSGPAYVYLFLKSMVDAGVYLGLPRETAEELAEETLLGSIVLKREINRNYDELISMVSSPGGTTVEALFTLEEEGFKIAIMKAIISAYNKSKRLGR